MIPFLDLQAQYRGIASELDAAVLDVLRGGEYVLGTRVAQFEESFAAYCGAGEAVALNSGTSALHLALLAVGVEPEDEVITVPMTFVATVAAIRYAGARPVLVDIDPVTWTMDPAALERAITPRTKAIVPVHLHGRLADMRAILAIAKRHGIAVIEDAAQAHGADFGGRRAGTFGDIGCFSFYPGKNLGACGEGGAIVTNRPDFASTIRQLRDWGQAGKYNHVRHGFNYRMDAIQGAVLGVKLKHVPEWTHKRQGHRRALRPAISEGAGSISPRKRSTASTSITYTRSAARIATAFAQNSVAKGIGTGVHYPRPVHLQVAYADLGYSIGDFPVSERLASETMSLPIYPELTEPAVRSVCDALHSSSEVSDVKADAA